MAPLALLHPLLLFFAGSLITTITSAFTPASSPFRFLAFILCSLISSLAFQNFEFYIQTTSWFSRAFCGAIFSVPIMLFDRLIIRKWAYESDDLGPLENENQTKKEKQKQKMSRWEFGSAVAGSNRLPGTSKEVANVPHFSDQNPGYVPSRSIFLIHHLSFVMGFYYLHSFCMDIQLLHQSSPYLADPYISFLSRVSEISSDEILTRVQVSLAYWVAQYCFIQLNYSAFALIAVSLNPRELQFWRPIFGSITLSCTIRGFWGKFWHQCIQLNVKGPAEYITHTILRIPRSNGDLFARYLKILLAFAGSGIMHVFVDSGGGVALGESGALRFFCTQTLGIMLEDAVQEIYRMMGGKQNWFCKAVGYLWVMVFLSWSSPTWVYPVARTMKREDVMFSINAVRPLVEYFF